MTRSLPTPIPTTLRRGLNQSGERKGAGLTPTLTPTPPGEGVRPIRKKVGGVAYPHSSQGAWPAREGGVAAHAQNGGVDGVGGRAAEPEIGRASV